MLQPHYTITNRLLEHIKLSMSY